MIKFLLQTTLNTLFPSVCVGCKKRHTPLCKKCLARISPSTQILGTTTPIFNYKNEVIKKALWALKYNGNKEVGKILARAMYDKMLEELSEESLFSNFYEPLLIPIPLSKKRLKKRGFNQSEVIAQEVHTLDNGTSFTLAKNVLYKIKDTPSQVSIKDKGARLCNLCGCFAVKNTEVVRDKNIILVDDITTTGATIAEAKKTLLAAGAKKVIAFTIAH